MTATNIWNVRALHCRRSPRRQPTPGRSVPFIAKSLLSAAVIILGLIAMSAARATERLEFVSERSYEETTQQLQWAFGGFGMTTVTAMDFQQILKKMKVGTSRAAIFEVMRRDWAKTLLEEDPSLGVVLPLRIYVFEDSDGKTMLSYDRPSRTLDTHPSEKVRAFGRLLDEKIRSVVLLATIKRNKSIDTEATTEIPRCGVLRRAKETYQFSP